MRPGAQGSKSRATNVNMDGSRMSDRWTVQIIPDDGGRTRTFRLGRGGALTAGVLLLLVGAGLAVGAVLLAGDTVESARVDRLTERNRELAGDLRAAERRTDELARALDGLAVKEERFRLLAGLPLIDPEVRQVGVGGPATGASSASASRELDRLLRRADLMAASLSEATDSLRLHREVFLSRPSIRPVAGEGAWISSGYSNSRHHPILLNSRPHTGIDISARPGAPIRASAQGTVTFAGRSPGYGKMVEIDHGYGYTTRYAHASRVRVAEGEEVRRGEVVAEVGQTGLTTGPNLHYEVLVGGDPIDPRPFLLDDRLFQ